ncbi:hypothetical protein E2C01_075740 [Portunus trituberculatus]|uniref:Uncharacterized protein n=1 Tax=Portunus trituberculatus TaxID=210409 RepID=A0A5B7IH34_PORTR|nr:hypothetical protein [Portunus trituberculatus]
MYTLARVYPLTWAYIPGPFKVASRPYQVRSPGETEKGENDGKVAITETNHVNLLSFRLVPSGRISNVVLSGHGEGEVGGELSGVWQREGGGAGGGKGEEVIEEGWLGMERDLLDGVDIQLTTTTPFALRYTVPGWNTTRQP